MNRSTTLGILIAFLLLSHITFAQVSKCCGFGVVAPEVQAGTGTAMAINSTTSAPTLAVIASGLPNTEYIITKRSTLAGSNPDGDVIVGTSVNGVFVPASKSRSGVSLAVGDVMDITAVGYDLADQKTLIDSILNGTTNGFSCCGIFPVLASVQKQGDPTFTSADSTALANYCDTLRAYNINGANDIVSFNEVLLIIEQLSNHDASSIESFIDGIELINENGNYISSDCGGQGAKDFLKYGINISSRAGTPLSMATAIIERLSPVSNFVIVPNPAQGQATLMISTQETTDLQITVFNTLGEQLQTQQEKGILGNQHIQLNLSTLTPNMYFVELNDGEHHTIKKLIIR